MPFFMGYQKQLKNELQKKYDVTLINSDQYDKEIIERYLNCNKIGWGLRHISRLLLERDQENAMQPFFSQIISMVSCEKNYYQIVLCINGAYIPNMFYSLLRKKNPNARFIYYAWDDIHNLLKYSHIRLFEEKYSYNINECKKYKMKYLPMFVQGVIEGHSDKDCYDLAYIASAHSDRLKIAEDLLQKYSYKYRLFIYLYDKDHRNMPYCKGEPLLYNEYIDIMRKSKAVLDIPHINQNGPTTRPFDALLTKTKVITTNKCLKDYPVYSENILVTDRDNFFIDEKFMNKPYVETKYRVLTISSWLDAMQL